MRPNGQGGTVDHPGFFPGQNILEIKNSVRRPLVGKGEEEEEEIIATVRFVRFKPIECPYYKY